jgi:hypothetical protein
MNVTLMLTLTDNEIPEFYNISTTIEELNTTLNSNFQLYFLQFNVLMISNEPIIISSTNNRRKKRVTDQTRIVIIIGSAYFVENQTGDEIDMSLQNYTQYISVTDVNGQISARLGVFSPGYSIFANAFSSTELTQDETNELILLC